MSEEEIKKTAPDSTGDKPQKEEQQPDTGREAIMRHATEDEAPLAAGITLRKILGGDFLTADVIRKQIGLIILIAFIIMIYIMRILKEDVIRIVHGKMDSYILHQVEKRERIQMHC